MPELLIEVRVVVPHVQFRGVIVPAVHRKLPEPLAVEYWPTMTPALLIPVVVVRVAAG
jgi:hypothetical protein